MTLPDPWMALANLLAPRRIVRYIVLGGAE
jgi:hypothetical protein